MSEVPYAGRILSSLPVNEGAGLGDFKMTLTPGVSPVISYMTKGR